MPSRNPEIDTYIADAAPFARPILEHIRTALHLGCPEIEENIKWGAPSFELNGIVAGMAAFKKHATYGFWRSGELDDPAGILSEPGLASFMAEKFTDVSQMPSLEILAEYVQRAVELNRSGKPKPTNPRLNKKKDPLEVPDDLAKLLADEPTAAQTFENLTISQQNEYVTWITDAKRSETRQRRLDTSLKRLARGEKASYKYE